MEDKDLEGIEGVNTEIIRSIWGFDVVKIDVNKEDELYDYIGNRRSIKTGKLSKVLEIDNAGECLADILNEFLKPYYGGTLLVVGLGNSEYKNDSLGPLSIDRLPLSFLTETKRLSRFHSVGALVPGVQYYNNIPTNDIICGVAAQIGASCIILIDAMETFYADNLLSIIHVSNAGLLRDSDLIGDKMNKETLGVPTIGIGVPTSLKCRVDEKEAQLTPVFCNEDIKIAANIISYGILRAVYQTLTHDTCTELIKSWLTN